MRHIDNPSSANILPGDCIVATSAQRAALSIGPEDAGKVIVEKDSGRMYLATMTEGAKPLSTNLAAELAAIAPAATIIVAADGSGDFTSISAAVNYLNTVMIDGKQLIRVTVEDGHYTEPSAILISQHIYFNVFLGGRNSYQRSISSVQSSSGGAGAWQHTINLDSSANAIVDDWVLISKLSGGTNPSYLAGALRVIDVDLPNNRITVECKHPNAIPPSGAVIGDCIILKTVVNFASGQRGFQVWNGATLGQMNNLMIVGTGASGLDVQDNGRVLIGTGPVGVSGFFNNVIATESAEITSASRLVASDAQFANFVSSTGGAHISLTSGSASSNAPYGIYGQSGGVIRSLDTTITGCTFGAYGLSGATLDVPSNSIISGCGTGVYSRTGAWCDGVVTQFSGNTLNADRMMDFGAIKVRGPYTPLASAEVGVLSYESGGISRYYIGPAGGYQFVLCSRVGGVTTDHFKWTDTGLYREISKEIDSANGLTAKTITKKNTYLTGTAGASLAITLPDSSASIDGQKHTIMSSTDRPTVTWISGSGGGFVAQPASLVAGVPITMQYDVGTLKWYPSN